MSDPWLVTDSEWDALFCFPTQDNPAAEPDSATPIASPVHDSAPAHAEMIADGMDFDVWDEIHSASSDNQDSAEEPTFFKEGGPGGLFSNLDAAVPKQIFDNDDSDFQESYDEDQMSSSGLFDLLATNISEVETAMDVGNPPQPEFRHSDEVHTRHLFPGFSLVQNLGGIPSPRAPSIEECKLIREYFGDDSRGIIFHSPFLVLRMEPLLPTPWPVTFADLPVWLTQKSSSKLPPFLGLRRGQKIPLLPQFAPITPWKVPHQNTFDVIIGYIMGKGLNLLSLSFLGNRWFVDIQGGLPFADLLPAHAGGLPIFYNSHMDLGTINHPQNFSACRVNIYEGSDYAETMSGMIVDSAKKILTISGTPLLHPDTQEICITASDHAFNIQDIVYRAYTKDEATPVATVFKNIEQTGIRLARVIGRNHYIKNHLGDHCESHCGNNRTLRGVEGLVIGTENYNIGSPWIGSDRFGQVILIGIQRSVLGPTENYQTNLLTYVGNDFLFPDHAFCGTHIYNALTREVVALFKCGMNSQGICSSSSAESIIELGYQIPIFESIKTLALDVSYPSVA